MSKWIELWIAIPESISPCSAEWTLTRLEIKLPTKNLWAISTLLGQPLKLIHLFTYLDSNISSTETDVNIRPPRVWNTIDWLLIKWKPNQSDKIKQDFFQVVAVSILLYGCTTMTLTKRRDKNQNGIYTRMLCAALKNPGSNTSQKTVAVRPLISHLTNHSSKTNTICEALQK